jgi:alkylation response protein AidB-like acyl-CoA dehydrogenase
MISFGPTEEQDLIRQTVHEFAAGEMREIARPCDEKRELPDELLQKSWELGWSRAEFGSPTAGLESVARRSPTRWCSRSSAGATRRSRRRP